MMVLLALLRRWSPRKDDDGEGLRPGAGLLGALGSWLQVELFVGDVNVDCLGYVAYGPMVVG